MFYKGNLKTADSVRIRDPLEKLDSFWHQGRYPVQFYDIEGMEESGMRDLSVHKASVDAHSKLNCKEANKTVS